MNLTEHSRNKIQITFDQWQIDGEYAQVMYNYLVHGLHPGGFFTSVLANDFVGAMARSHPGNTLTACKRLVGWIQDCMPIGAWGNYDAVKSWTALDESFRRQILEEHNLIYTEKEETWRVLNDA